MQKVLIHIGYHKTGSTWLQNELFRSSSNVFEPLSRVPQGQSTLARSFIYNREGYVLSPWDLNESVIKVEHKKIIQSNPGLKEKILVMSHEALSGNYTSGGQDAHSIARRIKNIFPESRVLIMVREQKSFILSAYFQYLRMGGVGNVMAFLEQKTNRRRAAVFSPDHLLYVPQVEVYQSMFGNDNVCVIPYELFLNQPAEFIGKLSSCVEQDILIDEKVFQKHWNRKGRHFTMYHLRYVNTLVKYPFQRPHNFMGSNGVSFLAGLLIKGTGKLIPRSYNNRTKNKIAATIENWVGDRYKITNQKLAKNLKMDLSKYGYY